MFEMLTTNGPSAWLPFLAQEWISATGNVVLVVLGFSLVVFVHELGHFLAAKWRQVRVERFSVGFGPELLGFTRGETRYSFCVLPLGGYVKMLGQEDFEIDKSGELAVKNDPRSFTNKPVSSRMIIVTAGVVMNLIFAALLYVVVYMVGREEIKPVIGYILPETPAARAGLTVGDRILSINGSHVSNFEQVLMGIRLSDPFSEITFDIERNGRIVHERIQPEKSEIDGEEVLRVGFNFADTPEIQSAYRGYLKQKTYPLPGDVIKKINGTDVGSTRGQAIMDLILQGADKPSKYPLIFQKSAVMILNKIDLLPHLDFDREKARRDALALNRDLTIFEVSCRTGAGLDGWFGWLTDRVARVVG